jgi:aspartokinase
MIKVGGMIEVENLTLYRFSDLIDKPGTAAQILTFFGEKRLNLEYITETSASDGSAAMTVCVEEQISEKIDEFLKNHQELVVSMHIVKTENVSIIGVYGPHFREKPAIASTFCALIGEAGVNILSLSSSISSISSIIDSQKMTTARQALLKYFTLP